MSSKIQISARCFRYLECLLLQTFLAVFEVDIEGVRVIHHTHRQLLPREWSMIDKGLINLLSTPGSGESCLIFVRGRDSLWRNEGRLLASILSISIKCDVNTVRHVLLLVRDGCIFNWAKHLSTGTYRTLFHHDLSVTLLRFIPRGKTRNWGERLKDVRVWLCYSVLALYRIQGLEWFPWFIL